VRVVFSGGGTGGHLYPGLAIARALVRERPDVVPHFVGAQRGVEHRVLPSQGFAYTLLDVHPLYRSKPWQNWRTVRGIVSGWRGVSALAREERPAIVVGTGGYASAIALAWAARNHVPLVQHVGDAFPGLAARFFAKYSRECYLGFSDAQKHMPPAGHYVVTGNPIDPPPRVRPDRASLLAQWRFDASTRVLLVFGGSQGSLALNEAVAGWVRGGIPAAWSVIWGTGRASYSRFAALESPRVRVAEYLSPIADAYGVADLALVRGGTMGLAELCAWSVPMVIVPLPTAAADHQTWNAKSLEAAGAAIHLPQRELSAARLSDTISGLVRAPERLAALGQAAGRRARPDAAADIARRIAALIPAAG